MTHTNNIEDEKINKMIATMKADWQSASNNKMVLVSLSKRRYLVIQLVSTDGPSPRSHFRGEIAYGPGTREQCEVYIESQHKKRGDGL